MNKLISYLADRQLALWAVVLAIKPAMGAVEAWAEGKHGEAAYLFSCVTAISAFAVHFWLNPQFRRIDVIVLEEDEDGGWVAESPNVPGAFSQGETRGEAIKNMLEAIRVHRGW